MHLLGEGRRYQLTPTADVNALQAFQTPLFGGRFYQVSPEAEDDTDQIQFYRFDGGKVEFYPGQLTPGELADQIQFFRFDDGGVQFYRGQLTPGEVEEDEIISGGPVRGRTLPSSRVPATLTTDHSIQARRDDRDIIDIYSLLLRSGIIDD